MPNKILIFGDGFIGRRIYDYFQLQSQISSKKIYSFQDAELEIKKYNPQIIINCIGYTGSRNVDDCENNIDKTLFSNSFIPIILAEVAFRRKIKLVHIASGCIFHYDYKKDKPIDEKRIPDYFNLFYSRSKIYSERAIEVLCKNYNVLIVRIRVPLDNRPHPKNLLTKLIRYKKVIDIPNSITYIPDFLKALAYLIKIDAKGIYNIVSQGALRYSELMEVYKRYVPNFVYEVVDFERLGLERTNLLLSTKKLKDAGFKILVGLVLLEVSL